MEHVKYLAARIRQALAEDPRSNTMDVQVSIAGLKVYLIGKVDSESRRVAAEEVAREQLLEGYVVKNELWVMNYNLPPETEAVP